MWYCKSCGKLCILKQVDSTPKPMVCPSGMDNKPNWINY